jgi:hypothetical protein
MYESARYLAATIVTAMKEGRRAKILSVKVRRNTPVKRWQRLAISRYVLGMLMGWSKWLDVAARQIAAVLMKGMRRDRQRDRMPLIA